MTKQQARSRVKMGKATGAYRNVHYIATGGRHVYISADKEYRIYVYNKDNTYTTKIIDFQHSGQVAQYLNSIPVIAKVK